MYSADATWEIKELGGDVIGDTHGYVKALGRRAAYPNQIAAPLPSEVETNVEL